MFQANKCLMQGLNLVDWLASNFKGKKNKQKHTLSAHPHPQFICWSLSPQCDGIWRWGFQSIITYKLVLDECSHYNLSHPVQRPSWCRNLFFGSWDRIDPSVMRVHYCSLLWSSNNYQKVFKLLSYKVYRTISIPWPYVHPLEQQRIRPYSPTLGFHHFF